MREEGSAVGRGRGMSAVLRLGIPLIAMSLTLDGCVGAGLHLARSAFGTSSTDQDKEKPPAERITAAQEQAISAALGGGPDTPIAWSDKVSGLQGTLVQDGGGDAINGCRHYRNTVILSGEVLRGVLAACPQQNGAWKLQGERGA